MLEEYVRWDWGGTTGEFLFGVNSFSENYSCTGETYGDDGFLLHTLPNPIVE